METILTIAKVILWLLFASVVLTTVIVSVVYIFGEVQNRRYYKDLLAEVRKDIATLEVTKTNRDKISKSMTALREYDCRKSYDLWLLSKQFNSKFNLKSK